MPRGQNINTRLLIKVSRYYYEQELTQKEISDRLKLSRSKVSRLLQQAKDLEIVKITVLPQPGFHTILEQKLEDKFGLDEAMVVEVSEPTSQVVVSREVGIAAAEFFMRVVEDNCTIGISWGTTLRAMVDLLPALSLPNTHVVQLIGGLGLPDSDAHVSYITQRLTTQIGSKLSILNMPGIVDSRAIKDVLLADSQVARVFKLFSQIQIAFVGIGSPTHDSVVMRDGTILSQPQLDSLKQKGTVGDICLRFFNKDGEIVDSEINDRVVGISLENLKQIQNVVGIAGGPHKLASIHAALKAGLVTTIITDHVSASNLLNL